MSVMCYVMFCFWLVGLVGLTLNFDGLRYACYDRCKSCHDGKIALLTARERALESARLTGLLRAYEDRWLVGWLIDYTRLPAT